MPKKPRRYETDELDDREEDDGVDGDALARRAIDVDGRSADQAKEDERGAEGLMSGRSALNPRAKYFQSRNINVQERD